MCTTCCTLRRRWHALSDSRQQRQPLTFRTLRRRTGSATTGASKPRSHSRRCRPQSTLRRWRSRRRSPTKVSPRSASLRSSCRARRSCRCSARCHRRARTPMCEGTQWRAFHCSTVRASFKHCTPQPPGGSTQRKAKRSITYAHSARLQAHATRSMLSRPCTHRCITRAHACTRSRARARTLTHNRTLAHTRVRAFGTSAGQ